MTISIEQLQRLGTDGKVVNGHGDKIGSIGQVYVDDTTGQPDWVTVKTGLFGTAESFVPLQGATVNGNDIVVGYDKDTVKAAPRVDADGDITPDEEQNLFRHYGLDDRADSGRTDGSNFLHANGDGDRTNGWDGTGDAPSDLDDPSEVGDHRPDISDRTVGYDRSGPTTDDAMTRSEERLQVGTTTRESGRARLRKYVQTENVSETVPVSHETARVVREPITDANLDQALSGPAISEEEHEVVLHDEVPVVQKTAVPVERVRLDKQTVTEQETVTEQVRKEQIESDDVSSKTQR
ncbi:MAG TPA: PRC and DUF2382 domain-containing protein [Propionibacteriaceae bacterium]|nr:PRC and DUF2382 domain-containing protein [Propionibacteriaceae bacterium]